MEGFLEPLWGRCGSCVVGFRASRTWHGCRRGCRRLLLSCLALSPCHEVEERNPRGSDGGSLESKGRLGMGATREGVREGSGHLGKPDHGQVGLRQVEGQRHPQALSRRRTQCSEEGGHGEDSKASRDHHKPQGEGEERAVPPRRS